MFFIPSRPSSPRRPGFRGSAIGLAATVAGLALSLFSVAPAQAALISTGACNEASLSQPFLRWSDANDYELLPGGDFEGSLAGWSVGAGATLSSGSEPFAATGSLGARSLRLGPGATVQSPSTCVNAAYPSFRFFGHSNGALSTLLVQVVYQTPLGTTSLPLNVVALTGQWQPTLPLLTGSVVGGLLSGGTAEVSLRFTELTGSSQIDDVFIDPHMR